MIHQRVLKNGQATNKDDYFRYLRTQGNKVPETWYWDDEEKMTTSWSKNARLIEAAGGVVKNQLGQLLIIFRNKKWDLPKGEVESGESYEAAAIREVYEETGIKAHINDVQSRCTFHLYSLIESPTFILKKTYWYLMVVEEDTVLPSPQMEEGIERVLFADRTTWRAYQNDAYQLIRDLVLNESIFD